MNALAPFIAQAAVLALVVSRLSGFVVASPFPGNNVGATQRVGLVVVLAWVASGFAASSAAPREIGLPLAWASMTELVCGVAIGFAFRLVFAAAEVLGQALSQATGLSSATILNPAVDAQDTALGRIVTLLALLIVISAGTHRVVLAYLLESFRAIPVGSALSFPAAAGTFVDMGGSAITVGVTLAMPVVAVSLVVQLGLALISRAAPSLQLFSVGLGILIATGCVTILASLNDMGTGMAAHFSSMAEQLDALFSALSGHAP